MINATRELRRELKELKIDNLKLSMSIDFPDRDFFDISCNDQLICVIGPTSIYGKVSDGNLAGKEKEFYEKTKLTKAQALKIERIAEKWRKKYSQKMI